MKMFIVWAGSLLTAGLLVTVGAFAQERDVVEFEIAPGHGTAPWNSENDPLEIHLGMTLRVINLDDSASHTLHTAGRPCPHGGNRLYDADGTLLVDGSSFDAIPVGGWIECDIDMPPANASSGYFLYDHYSGPSARFYLTLVE